MKRMLTLIILVTATAGEANRLQCSYLVDSITRSHTVNVVSRKTNVPRWMRGETPESIEIKYVELTIPMSRYPEATGLKRTTDPVKVYITTEGGKIIVYRKMPITLNLTLPVFQDFVAFTRSLEFHNGLMPNGEIAADRFGFYAGNIKGKISLTHKIEVLKANQNDSQTEGLTKESKVDHLAEVLGLDVKNDWVLAVEYSPGPLSKAKTIEDFAIQFKQFMEPRAGTEIPSSVNDAVAESSSEKSVLNKLTDRFARFRSRLMSRMSSKKVELRGLDLAEKMGFEVSEVQAGVRNFQNRLQAFLNGETNKMKKALSSAGDYLDQGIRVESFMDIYSLKPNDPNRGDGFSIVYIDRSSSFYGPRTRVAHGIAPKGIKSEDYLRLALQDYFVKAISLDPNLVFQTLRDDLEPNGSIKPGDKTNLSKSFQQFIIENSDGVTPIWHADGLFFKETPNPNVVRVFGQSPFFNSPQEMLSALGNNQTFEVVNVKVLQEPKLESGYLRYRLQFVAELRLR